MRKEERGVQYLRIAVYLVVIVTGLVVSLGTYFYTKNQQQDIFREAFSTNANKLAQAFFGSVDRKIAAVGGLSTKITNYALTHNMSFPFVTVDNWESLSVQTRIQADGMKVEWAPLVTDDQRAEWEDYAWEHKIWREAAYAREQAYIAEQDQYFGLESTTAVHLDSLTTDLNDEDLREETGKDSLATPEPTDDQHSSSNQSSTVICPNYLRKFIFFLCSQSSIFQNLYPIFTQPI